ncbi:MAG TPA: transposase, partial [Actinomycetota bacterium]|nr:transposase [Actinomycetota bacterium]
LAEIAYTPFATKKDPLPVRLIVRRVPPTPGSQLALYTDYSYHAFITDRVGNMVELEADHRAHAEVENAIRDLKHGLGLNHMPSGRFGANAAWLAFNTIAHNLVRWVARIGLEETLVMTKTMRRRYFSMPGRTRPRLARTCCTCPRTGRGRHAFQRRWSLSGRSRCRFGSNRPRAPNLSACGPSFACAGFAPTARTSRDRLPMTTFANPICLQPAFNLLRAPSAA